MSRVVPAQVAEIIVELGDKQGRRGSGYRVAPNAVLTAAHVIEDAVSVRVRFDADQPGEWSTEAISCWTDQYSDLAVLTIPAHEGQPPVAVPRFGRISGDRAAVLAAQAVRFPRFKLRSDDDGLAVYRDSHQVDGSVAVLSNRREGTLELTVSPPERDPDPGASPWGRHVRRRAVDRWSHRWGKPVTNRYQEVWLELAEVLAAGDLDQAEIVTDRITDYYRRGRTLVQLVTMTASAGDAERVNLSSG